MSVLAAGVRDRAFRRVLRGFEPGAVRAALESATTEIDGLRAEIARLQQQHAEAVAEIERIAALERSLVRACVAAEEDAQIRSAAARRHAARIIAAAQHDAAARLEAPSHERDRLVRDVGRMRAASGLAAGTLAQLIADLRLAADDNRDRVMSSAALDQEDVLADAPAMPVAQAPLDATPAAGETAAQPEPEAEPVDVAIPDSRARRDAPRRRIRTPIAAGAAAAVLLVFQGSAGAPPSRRGTPEISAAGMVPVAAAAAAAADAPAPNEAQPGSRASLASGATAAAPAASGLTIRIKPLRRCWVRVVVDDRTDARELMPGEDILLDARRTIVLRVGDAGALSIEVNGRVLPPLGQDGQVVERRFNAETHETPVGRD